MNLNEFISKVKELGIELNDNQINQFNKYYELLVEYNKVMNLTGITEYEEVLEKHFYDSLTMANKVSLNNSTLVDIGAGAGFPCIPLKIAFPHLKIVLLDSLNKRINFLNIVIEELGLEKIETIHARAEEAGRNKIYREQFDLCVSRAVANTATLSEYCLPFIKVGGKFIPYKASDIEEELNQGKKAIQVLGGKLTEVKKLTLPDSDIERSFLFIDKVKNTPKTYPRKAGTASKEPIH